MNTSWLVKAGPGLATALQSRSMSGRLMVRRGVIVCAQDVRRNVGPVDDYTFRYVNERPAGQQLPRM